MINGDATERLAMDPISLLVTLSFSRVSKRGVSDCVTVCESRAEQGTTEESRPAAVLF